MKLGFVEECRKEEPIKLSLVANEMLQALKDVEPEEEEKEQPLHAQSFSSESDDNYDGSSESE